MDSHHMMKQGLDRTILNWKGKDNITQQSLKWIGGIPW